VYLGDFSCNGLQRLPYDGCTTRVLLAVGTHASLFGREALALGRVWK
jgi:hypothetical protein